MKSQISCQDNKPLAGRGKKRNRRVGLNEKETVTRGGMPSGGGKLEIDARGSRSKSKKTIP